MSLSPRKLLDRLGTRGEGLKLAVRYSLPSCQLGFCGPQNKKNQRLLSEFALGENVPQEEIRQILEKFEAMYPYLKLIASSNQISDPFDEQVVRAFWVGNKLLDNVKIEDLRRMIVTELVGPGLLLKKEAEKRASQIPEGAVPHHSFHVLFLGSITGRVDLSGALKDLCRIGWGKVIEVKSEKLKIKSRPLVLAKKIRLGEEVEKEVDWDKRAAPGIKVGDWVSFHWGQVCDRLSVEDVANLEHYTEKTISGLS